MMTATKERPILFSGLMVKAILAGKKTQTRRIAKLTAGGHVRLGGRRWHPKDEAAALACPYGQPGDRLWVKETWQHEDGSCSDHKCGQPTHIYHKATEVYPESIRWRPSIFMQRWASRLTLDVVSVRVERLQDISAEDVYAEGVGAFVQSNLDVAREMFARLWNSINEERGHGWESNPYVWAVEFGVHVS